MTSSREPFRRRGSNSPRAVGGVFRHGKLNHPAARLRRRCIQGGRACEQRAREREQGSHPDSRHPRREHLDDPATARVVQGGQHPEHMAHSVDRNAASRGDVSHQHHADLRPNNRLRDRQDLPADDKAMNAEPWPHQDRRRIFPATYDGWRFVPWLDTLTPARMARLRADGYALRLKIAERLRGRA